MPVPAADDRSTPSASKRPRDDGSDECAGGSGDDSRADPVRVWGVLVAQTTPTRESGLLALAQRRQRPAEQLLHAPAHALAVHDAGQVWLWQHLPPALRRHCFLEGQRSPDAHGGAGVAPTSPQQLFIAEEETEEDNDVDVDAHAAAPPLLILPLCDTRSNNGAVSIGRLASNDLVLAANPCVSSVHCSIACRPARTQHGRSADGVRAATATATPPRGDTKAAARAAEPATTTTPPPQQQQPSPSATPVVVLSDVSTNGCAVNGRPVGRGQSVRLRSRDVVSLVDAGPRHTAEYNLSFVFLDADDVVPWILEHHAEVQLPLAHAQPPPSARVSTTPAEVEEEQQQHLQDQQQRSRAAHAAARRRALLCKARWSVEAQVQRMYHHSVDNFYALDRAQPLGQGTFGTVYRATLLPVPSTDTAAGAVVDWSQLFSSAGVAVWATVPAEEARLREAYVHDRERQPPAAVLRAAASAAPHVFAVKVIRKRRLLLEALQQQPQDGSDAAVVEQLVLLETQPDDLATRRRAEWTAGALASLQLSESASSPPLSLEALYHPCLPTAEADTRRSHGEREQRRRALLLRLPDALRRAYEKELQHRRRQQCEINILLAVHHPNVAALYEVFDQPDHLALVMEEATGGEVWDLLQPYTRRRQQQQQQQRAINTTSTTGLDDDDDDDDDLVCVGGALPEYAVKIIVVQVLEAVLYLHTMGILHRDLKLENLMLRRPLDRYALNALQLQTLLHRLRTVTPAAGSGDVAVAVPAAEAGEEEFTNPLSVLHTVHVPRHLWPVVKVMDFGLSRVLDQLQTRPSAPTSTQHAAAQQPEAAAAAAAERVKVIYSRHDATTSCGTPIYAAPEVTVPALRPDKAGYSAAVDMYSIGVVAYALLTGRAPFPSRKHPRRPHGPPVVDYDAPLRFQRHRHRPAAPPEQQQQQQQQQRQPRPAPAAAVPVVCLPPLSVVESVRVTLPRDDADTSPTAASEETRRWRQQIAAVAARVGRAERERGATSTGDGAAALFGATVEQLNAALSAYADGCAAAGTTVDLDRLVYVAADAAATGAAVRGDAGRVSDADGRVVDVPLPSISALGASFLRGLLEKHPTQRFTAYEALQHPWLRECVREAPG
ncbi:serine-threonine protein kinase-like protein [Novymonas esmeraldas]|uniref:non-specific serine/threonine protein kinase n=1 Tax=Novymonas esmeraldas TaxID=1808958 RepID=A0AAW0FEN1_9TRYP